MQFEIDSFTPKWAYFFLMLNMWRHGRQCDQIGILLYYQATYYCTKVAQMFTNFWAIIKMSLLKRKTALATFGQLLGNIGPLSIPVSGHTDGRAKKWYSSLKNFFASWPLLKLFPFCHLPPKNHIFSFYCSNGPTSSQQASHCSLILFQEGRAGGGGFYNLQVETKQ